MASAESDKSHKSERKEREKNSRVLSKLVENSSRQIYKFILLQVKSR